MQGTGGKQPKPPGLFIWQSVTLFWGTVFYWSSLYMLERAATINGTLFDPAVGVRVQVYGLQVVGLVVIALLAMMVRSRLDPGNRRQIERWQNISAGKGEKIFISFAGSLATGFGFTLLTVGSYVAYGALTGYETGFTTATVLLASLFNTMTGIAASLVVGLVFLIAGIGRKRA